MPSASSRLSAVYGFFLVLENQNLSFSLCSTNQDRKITEEEAESAEVPFGKRLDVFLTFRKGLKEETLFPLHAESRALGRFYLCGLRDLCG
jgi:hypothetical protein